MTLYDYYVFGKTTLLTALLCRAWVQINQVQLP